jgi:hypothetical protein
MSDEDETPILTVIDDVGGATLQVGGLGDRGFGTSGFNHGPNAMFSIGDPETSPLLRFLLQGNMRRPRARVIRTDAQVVQLPLAAAWREGPSCKGSSSSFISGTADGAS